jgi:hypothetical protein
VQKSGPSIPAFDLRKHLSIGFAWSGGGDGPARQLALALLADALQNDARASRVHHDFSSRVIPLFPKRWTITRSRIIAYVDRIEMVHNTTLPVADTRRPYSGSLPPGTFPPISL